MSKTAAFTAGLRALYASVENAKSSTGGHSNRHDSPRSLTDEAGNFQPLPPVPLLGGRYKYIEQLGRGTFAVLIRAQDMHFTHGTRHVAIKIMNAEYGDLGEHETNVLQQLALIDPLDTCHIVQSFGTFYFREHYCIVFELLSRTQLRHAVEAASQFTSAKKGSEEELKHQAVRKIFAQLMTAMAAFEKANLIHADIKPDNILLRDGAANSCFLKVIDFGNCIFNTDDDVSPYFEEFTIQTPLYRAPEVFFGLPFGPEIDMWSCGCILLELLLGRPWLSLSSQSELVQAMVDLLGFLPAAFQDGKFSAKYPGTIDEDFHPLRDMDQSHMTLTSRLQDKLGFNSPSLASFLAGMLHPHPGMRMTPTEALLHPFLAPLFPFRMLTDRATYGTTIWVPSESRSKSRSSDMNVALEKNGVDAEATTPHGKGMAALLRRPQPNAPSSPTREFSAEKWKLTWVPHRSREAESSAVDEDVLARVGERNSARTKGSSKGPRFKKHPSEHAKGLRRGKPTSPPASSASMLQQGQHRISAPSSSSVLESSSAFTAVLGHPHHLTRLNQDFQVGRGDLAQHEVLQGNAIQETATLHPSSTVEYARGSPVSTGKLARPGHPRVQPVHVSPKSRGRTRTDRSPLPNVPPQVALKGRRLKASAKGSKSMILAHPHLKAEEEEQEEEEEENDDDAGDDEDDDDAGDDEDDDDAGDDEGDMLAGAEDGLHRLGAKSDDGELDLLIVGNVSGRRGTSRETQRALKNGNNSDEDEGESSVSECKEPFSAPEARKKQGTATSSRSQKERKLTAEKKKKNTKKNAARTAPPSTPRQSKKPPSPRGAKKVGAARRKPVRERAKAVILESESSAEEADGVGIDADDGRSKGYEDANERRKARVCARKDELTPPSPRGASLRDEDTLIEQCKVHDHAVRSPRKGKRAVAAVSKGGAVIDDLVQTLDDGKLAQKRRKTRQRPSPTEKPRKDAAQKKRGARVSKKRASSVAGKVEAKEGKRAVPTLSVVPPRVHDDSTDEEVEREDERKEDTSADGALEFALTTPISPVPSPNKKKPHAATTPRLVTPRRRSGSMIVSHVIDEDDEDDDDEDDEEDSDGGKGNARREESLVNVPSHALSSPINARRIGESSGSSGDEDENESQSETPGGFMNLI